MTLVDLMGCRYRNDNYSQLKVKRLPEFFREKHAVGGTDKHGLGIKKPGTVKARSPCGRAQPLAVRA